MLETEFKLEYEIEELPADGGVPVIVVAAGSSTRMNGINKQTALLCGVPLIIRTLMQFEKCSKISNIILVVKPDELFSMQQLADGYSIKKLSDIVCGGESRQQMQRGVLRGGHAVGKAQFPQRLPENAETVLIHDGARPFVTDEIICGVISALSTHNAVTCTVKLKDTVKQVDENGNVLSTPDRNTLVAVQTPQGVNVSDYRAALESSVDLGRFTDDMSVMEAAGHKPFTVPGSYENIKVTTPEDIALAEYLILKDEKE